MSFIDNQSIVSELTFETSTSEFNQRFNEICDKLEININKLNFDTVKDKCKEYCIKGISTSKKAKIIELLMVNYKCINNNLLKINITELKNICKKYNIKGYSGLKKEDLILKINIYCADNFIFNIDFNTVENNIIQNDLQINFDAEQKRIRDAEMEMEQKRVRDAEMEMEQKRVRDAEMEMEQKRIRDVEMEMEQKNKEKNENKKKKQAIPKNVRTIIWNHYIGEDIIKHKCLCCKKVTIHNTNFEVGHVISEKNNGTHEINNLRPICSSCNHSMGTENMITFVCKYGLYIG